MILLFWLAIFIIIYTFLGYPLLITLAAKRWQRPYHTAPITPSLTLLIPAYNEADIIAAKLANSLALNYPPDRRQIIVVADGSDDATATIAQAFPDVTVHHQPERKGKIAAVNRIIPLIESDIIVFTDANTMLDPDSLLAIAQHFADPNVAGVAGEKQVRGGGEGLYWRYESYLKQCDSALSSVMGAAGELFAIRRALYAPPEADSIIEDFVISLRLVGDGWRMVYEPTAVAREEPLTSLTADWQRRTRIAAGGFQSMLRLPHLLNPRQGRVAWQYLSHRVLRWAVTPFLLPLLFVLNVALAKRPFYRLLLLLQTLFYGLGVLGYLRGRRGARSGLLHAIFFFCFTHLAALAGFWRFITRSQPVTWRKTR